MNGTPSWLHTAGSVINAIITDRPAPARQVFIYTLVLIALAYLAPKIAKLVSK